MKRASTGATPSVLMAVSLAFSSPAALCARLVIRTYASIRHRRKAFAQISKAQPMQDPLPGEAQGIVLNWIRQNILPRKTPLLSNSSYGLKHMLERDTDIYMTNNQFKDAMLACGFLPVNERELNWHYCISRRSPAFTHVGGTYGGV